jgi:hypothetical protein
MLWLLQIQYIGSNWSRTQLIGEKSISKTLTLCKSNCELNFLLFSCPDTDTSAATRWSSSTTGSSSAAATTASPSARPTSAATPTSTSWWRFHESPLWPEWPGVDVMITIFCDFQSFSAKKLTFFSKTNVIIKILHYLALFRVKNDNFVAIFWRKYF